MSEHYDEDYYEPRRRRRRDHRRFRPQRVLPLIIALALFWGIGWFVYSQGYLDPLIEIATPMWNKLAALIDDPLGVDWGGMFIKIASVAILHIGLILMLFDNDRRL